MTYENQMLHTIDTHILIWYFTGNKRLQKRLKERIDKVRDKGGRLLVPTIVLAEALDIFEKGKVEFDFYKMYHLISEESAFEIVGFELEIFALTLKIKDVKEIHDRIILATAKFYGASILTKDRIIKESGEIDTF